MYDITALGEILIDFTYAGEAENGMRLFQQNPGGAPANVLSAAAHLGAKTAFIGKVGADMHGGFLKQTLLENSIETKGLVSDENAFTTLAFVSLDEKGDRSFSFARKPGADTLLTCDEIKKDLITDSSIFHIGSLSLTDEPVRSATFCALECAKNAGVTISYDPNYRAPLWSGLDTARTQMRSVLPYVNIIKLSEEELLLLADSDCGIEASKRLIDGGADIVLVTLGAKGSLVRTREGFKTIASYPVKAVDTTGAGDAYMGAFLYMLATGGCKPCDISLSAAIAYADFATAAANCCITKRGAINAMPTMQEAKAMQEKYSAEL